jgi:Cof subfamily protein (haloacid dehalogenase superfamily)
MSSRLLVFDLDGTLLASDRTIHPRNLALLRAAMERGVLVSLATGRSPRSTAPYANAVRPNAPIVHFNGARTRRWDTGEVLVDHRLPTRDAIAAVEVGARLGLHVNLYVGDEIYIAARTPASEASEYKDVAPHTEVGSLVPFLERLDTEPIKLLFVGPPELFPRFREEARQAMMHPCTVVNSEPHYFEVLPPGVTKGAAVVDLAGIIGVPLEDVIAFGDGPNDVEMLEACGLGVAMGNARQDLIRVADVVIGHHDTDAIARFLEATLDRP